MRDITTYFVLFALALLLIIMGIQGSLGKVMAVIFVPADLTVTNTSGGGSTF